VPGVSATAVYDEIGGFHGVGESLVFVATAA
jgi:hypothetical protein